MRISTPKNMQACGQQPDPLTRPRDAETVRAAGCGAARSRTATGKRPSLMGWLVLGLAATGLTPATHAGATRLPGLQPWPGRRMQAVSEPAGRSTAALTQSKLDHFISTHVKTVQENRPSAAPVPGGSIACNEITATTLSAAVRWSRNTGLQGMPRFVLTAEFDLPFQLAAQARMVNALVNASPALCRAL